MSGSQDTVFEERAFILRSCGTFLLGLSLQYSNHCSEPVYSGASPYQMNPSVGIWCFMVVEVRLDTQHSPRSLSKIRTNSSVVDRESNSGLLSAFETISNTASRLNNDQQQIRQDLRQKIQLTLEIAKDLPPVRCVSMIRRNLADIQNYCAIFGKTFIVVEQNITCDQYDLQGAHSDKAILFRGPDERATVAICVTEKGSLLHRNDSAWTVYRDVGDILVHPLAA